MMWHEISALYLVSWLMIPHCLMFVHSCSLDFPIYMLYSYNMTFSCKMTSTDFTPQVVHSTEINCVYHSVRKILMASVMWCLIVMLLLWGWIVRTNSDKSYWVQVQNILWIVYLVCVVLSLLLFVPIWLRY